MNILFITIAWPREGERNLYTDLMEEFVTHGHKVYVACTYTKTSYRKYKLSDENGIKVLRIPSGQVRKVNHFQKAVSLLSLGEKIFKGLMMFYKEVRFDLILSPTPPITLSKLYIKVKKFYNAPFYLLLKDMWPQGSVDLKVFRKYSIPWMFFRSHEIRLYKSADHIGCMSPMGVRYILSKNKFIPSHKIEVCPNSIKPLINGSISKKKNGDTREKYNIPYDSCVFIFSGNLGIGHGLNFLLDVIKELANYDKAFFVIGGSGTQYEYLKGEFNKFHPKNAFLYKWLPREDFNNLMVTSDVGLILLYKYTSPQFPSRLLSYLEYSKPVLCAVNQYTDIGNIVEDFNCGLSVNHGDKTAFISKIKYLSENMHEREEMGRNARKLLLENYTVSHSYEIIMKHFKEQQLIHY